MFAGKFQFTDGCARIWLGLNAKHLASHLKDNASNWTVQNLSCAFHHRRCSSGRNARMLLTDGSSWTRTWCRTRTEQSRRIGGI